jgi:hypothetical protein
VTSVETKRQAQPRTPRTSVSRAHSANQMPKPWLEPGFTFGIGWPAGFEVAGVSPFSGGAADTRARRAAAGEAGGQGVARAQISASMREGGMAAVNYGFGTIVGMARRTAADVDKNEGIRRGAL